MGACGPRKQVGWREVKYDLTFIRPLEFQAGGYLPERMVLNARMTLAHIVNYLTRPHARCLDSWSPRISTAC
jgi:hypothetical protein